MEGAVGYMTTKLGSGCDVKDPIFQFLRGIIDFKHWENQINKKPMHYINQFWCLKYIRKRRIRALVSCSISADDFTRIFFLPKLGNYHCSVMLCERKLTNFYHFECFLIIQLSVLANFYFFTKKELWNTCKFEKMLDCTYYPKKYAYCLLINCFDYIVMQLLKNDSKSKGITLCNFSESEAQNLSIEVQFSLSSSYLAVLPPANLTIYNISTTEFGIMWIFSTIRKIGWVLKTT